MKAVALVFLLAAHTAFAQQPAPQPGKFFDAADTNRDGAISKAEWAAGGRNPQGFQMMDANRDGKVTREEGRAAMQKMMQMQKLAPK